MDTYIGSYAHMASMSSFRPSLIIDSKATNHMTSIQSIFKTYKPSTSHGGIRVANEHCTPVISVGSVDVSKQLS